MANAVTVTAPLFKDRISHAPELLPCSDLAPNSGDLSKTFRAVPFQYFPNDFR